MNAFLKAIRATGWSDSAGARREVIARMRDYLPSSELQFLMELSIDPLVKRLFDR